MDQLKTIATFVQVARSLSLSRAASELGISRSLASNHLKLLEEHLGVTLVRRTTRHLILTGAGSEYLSFCTEMLTQFEAAEARISRVQDEPSGHLKIMVPMTFGSMHLAPIINTFAKRYPEIKTSLILLDRGFSSEDFMNGAFDLGISLKPLKDASTMSTRIGEVRWIPWASQVYLESHPPIDTPEDLQAHNCLVHRSHSPNSVWHFSGPSGRHDVKVSGSLFTNSVLVLRDAVLEHLGVAMLPRYGLPNDLQPKQLRPLLIDYRSHKWPVYIVYPQSRFMPKRTRLLIDLLKQEMKLRQI